MSITTDRLETAIACLKKVQPKNRLWASELGMIVFKLKELKSQLEKEEVCQSQK